MAESDPIWPVEARSIAEAYEIWARHGVTNIRVMSREELTKRFGLLVIDDEPPTPTPEIFASLSKDGYK